MIEAASLPTLVLVAMTGLFSVLLFFGLRAPEERRSLLVVATLSYILKAVLAALYYQLLVKTGYEGYWGVDAYAYGRRAYAMASQMAAGLEVQYEHSDPGYSLLIASAYLLTGAHTLVARFINVTFSTWTLLYVHRIARLTFGERVARIAVLLTAFMPYPMTFTFDHRKEAVVLFVTTFLVFHALKILRHERGWGRHVFYLLLGLSAVFYLRQGFILPFIAVLLMSFFASQRSPMQGIAVSAFAIVGLLALQFVAPQGSRLERLGFEAGAEKLESYFQIRAAESEIPHGLLRYTMMGSPLEIYKLPLATLLMIVMPFPPQFLFTFEHVPRMIMTWSNVVFLMFLPQLLFGLLESFRTDRWRERVPLVIYLGVFIVLLTISNPGNIRYKQTVMPVMFVLMAAGFTARQRILWIGAIYGGLGLLAVVVLFRRFG